MKLAGKELVFRLPQMRRSGRWLRFLRRGNTIQLLETAVVVEGYQQRFTMPVIDAFFRRALSEWTTVTIPYSRILEYRFRSRRVIRWVLTIAVWLPALLMAMSVLDNFEKGRPEGFKNTAIGVAMFGALAAVLSLYFFFEGCTPRNTLTFRKADGKRASLLFSIRAKGRQKAFQTLLEGNLKAVGPAGGAP
jgi:hypothetical protein